jgi:hypothetical protein
VLLILCELRYSAASAPIECHSPAARRPQHKLSANSSCCLRRTRTHPLQFQRHVHMRFVPRVSQLTAAACARSVDGMHATDLAWAHRVFPSGGFATLAKQAITAYTQVPTDSFPGLLSLVTGALHPRCRVRRVAPCAAVRCCGTVLRLSHAARAGTWLDGRFTLGRQGCVRRRSPAFVAYPSTQTSAYSAVWPAQQLQQLQQQRRAVQAEPPVATASTTTSRTTKERAVARSLPLTTPSAPASPVRPLPSTRASRRRTRCKSTRPHCRA